MVGRQDLFIDTNGGWNLGLREIYCCVKFNHNIHESTEDPF